MLFEHIGLHTQNLFWIKMLEQGHTSGPHSSYDKGCPVSLLSLPVEIEEKVFCFFFVRGARGREEHLRDKEHWESWRRQANPQGRKQHRLAKNQTAWELQKWTIWTCREGLLTRGTVELETQEGSHGAQRVNTELVSVLWVEFRERCF